MDTKAYQPTEEWVSWETGESRSRGDARGTGACLVIAPTTQWEYDVIQKAFPDIYMLKRQIVIEYLTSESREYLGSEEAKLRVMDWEQTTGLWQSNSLLGCYKKVKAVYATE